MLSPNLSMIVNPATPANTPPTTIPIGPKAAPTDKNAGNIAFVNPSPPTYVKNIFALEPATIPAAFPYSPLAIA